MFDRMPERLKSYNRLNWRTDVRGKTGSITSSRIRNSILGDPNHVRREILLDLAYGAVGIARDADYRNAYELALLRSATMYLPNFLDGFDRLVAFDAETTGKRTPDAEFVRKQPFAWRPLASSSKSAARRRGLAQGRDVELQGTLPRGRRGAVCRPPTCCGPSSTRALAAPGPSGRLSGRRGKGHERSRPACRSGISVCRPFRPVVP